MKFAELIPLTAGVVNLLLTLFVLSQGLRSGTARVYLLWGLSLSVWNLGTYFMFQEDLNSNQALFWARFLQYGVIFLPISLAHLCYLVGHIPVGRGIAWGYLLHVALAASNFTPLFIADVREVSNDLYRAHYSVAGPGYWVLVATFSVPALAVYRLGLKVKTLPPMHRRRVYGMIGAVVALILFGFNDSLPILNVDRYPFTNIPIFPFGSAAAILYGIIVGYSVLQHQLLDIHVTLSRLVARTVRLLFLFLTGMALLLVLTVVAPGEFTAFSFSSSLAVLLVSAWLASTFFPRLFGSGEEKLERRILGDKFEYHDRMRGFVEAMQWMETNELLDSLHQLMTQTVRAASYRIFVREEKTGVFSLFRSHPALDRDAVPRLNRASPVFKAFEAAHADCVNLQTTGPQTSEDDPHVLAAREQLAPLQAEYAFLLQADEQPFGLFLIGPKLTREPYTLHDLELFSEMVAKLGLHLNQVRMKRQLLLAQEMDLLGMMSRGMAHDLNNLITPVWTYLQLARERARPEESHNELLPTVSRNVQTMMDYIRESLFFSDTQTPHLALASLGATARKAVDLIRPRADGRGVRLECEGVADVEIEMDAVLVQRLINNLLANAVDASPPGSVIRVRVATLDTTEPGRTWHRVEVIDQGEGISRENLRQVTMPYFTTKDHGDERRGFGLGLAICRKIVHLHGGNLNILSEVGQGTTVQVDLPSRQTQPPVNGELRRP